MNKEELEAIDYIKQMQIKHLEEIKLMNSATTEAYENIRIILNLIEKQQAELEEVTKQRNKLATELSEQSEELENWKFTAKYVEDNYVDKNKIREIIDNNLKNTKVNPNGYCFSFEGCQKVSKEIFALLREKEDGV